MSQDSHHTASEGDVEHIVIVIAIAFAFANKIGSYASLYKDIQNTSEKMGRFADSLQEVLSYFILSPRCLDDGSKVAYGGREGLVTPPGWS